MTSANGNRQHRTSSAPSDSKRAARGKCKRQFITFIIGIFLVGGIAGGLIVGGVHALGGNDTEKQQPYGTRDGKVITDDGVLTVQSSDFVPLECALSDDLQEYTYYMCQAYYIDFDFVMALMFTESSFRTDVVSKTNDYGLMQINSINHKELEDKLGITDLTDGYQNIRAGLYILRGMFEKYDDEAKVLMAYNMGDYGASVLWKRGVYTTSYTNKILAKADEYAAQRATQQ